MTVPCYCIGPLGPAGPPFPLVQPTSRHGPPGHWGHFPSGLYRHRARPAARYYSVGPPGLWEQFPSVLNPSKTGCSVLLCGPTGPDRFTGSPRPLGFMFGIISVEVLVTLKALFFNTGGLSIISVSKTGLANRVH